MNAEMLVSVYGWAYKHLIIQNSLQIGTNSYFYKKLFSYVPFLPAVGFAYIFRGNINKWYTLF